MPRHAPLRKHTPSFRHRSSPCLPRRRHFMADRIRLRYLSRSGPHFRMPSSPTRRAAFALVALFAACDKAPAKPFVPPPAQVGIVTVAPTNIAEAYEFVGQVSPFRRVEVRSRVEGIVTERPFIEGSVVRRVRCCTSSTVVRYDAAYRAAVARLDNAKRTVARLEPLVPKRARRAAGRRQRALGARVGAGRGRCREEGSRRHGHPRRDRRAGRTRAARARRARHGPGGSAHDDR